MAKKPAQSTKQGSASLIGKEVKNLTAERGRDDYLCLDNIPKIFFRLPNLKK